MNMALLEDRINILRQKVEVTRQAKRLGQIDLYDYSISSAEMLIQEVEEYINENDQNP